MEMTFPLKETKAILQLCESAGMALTLILESSGRPIVFRMKFYTHFEVDFVLATAIPNSSQSTTTPSSSSHASATPSTPNRQRSSCHPRHQTNNLHRVPLVLGNANTLHQAKHRNKAAAPRRPCDDALHLHRLLLLLLHARSNSTSHRLHRLTRTTLLWINPTMRWQSSTRLLRTKTRWTMVATCLAATTRTRRPLLHSSRYLQTPIESRSSRPTTTLMHSNELDLFRSLLNNSSM